MDRKILLGIDFNNMLIGSYYGEKLINSKGQNVNAIKGFFFKLKAIRDAFNPDIIVFASDLSRSKTFRRQLYPPYKAQRGQLDPDIIVQMGHASRISKLLGFPFINNETYEADDILGMIAKFANERNMDVILSSTDRDLYQLINDNTYIFSHRNKEIIDRGWMYEKYKLTPEQWIELKMLQGDNSDNIPGVKGIGEVGALKLMKEFGSIENIYNHLGSVKQGVRDALLKGHDDLPLMRTLVTIVTDYRLIDLKPEMLERQEIYKQEIYESLEELELFSLFNVMNYSLLLNKEEMI